MMIHLRPFHVEIQLKVPQQKISRRLAKFCLTPVLKKIFYRQMEGLARKILHTPVEIQVGGRLP
jgi:hypothetical protein